MNKNIPILLIAIGFLIGGLFLIKNKMKVGEQNLKSEFKYSRSIDPLISNINNLFIKLNSFSEPFVINDALVNKALDYIANFNKIIVTFDIEFHNIVKHNKVACSEFIGIIKNEREVSPFVREIGVIFLAKDVTNKWNFLGILFVNFNNDYKNNDVIYILSKYATVTDSSKKIMMNGDKYFNIQETINKIIQTNNDSQITDLNLLKYLSPFIIIFFEESVTVAYLDKI